MTARLNGQTMEQRIYDLMLSCGGKMRAQDIGKALGLRKDEYSGAGYRLARRGAIIRHGQTFQSLWTIVGERPTDKRGGTHGSQGQWYGKGTPRDEHRGRGRTTPNKPKAHDARDLWHAWGAFPRLHDAQESISIPGGTVRPQET